MTEVRRATLEDVPACAEVLGAWIDGTEWIERYYSNAEFGAMIQAVFDSREIWVAGDPVDAYLSFDPETAKIGALYCARTGQGVGKALMDRVRAGRDYVWLTTEEPNHPAHRFYHREGFKEVGRLPAEPPEVLPLIKMEWRR